LARVKIVRHVLTQAEQGIIIYLFQNISTI